MPFTTTFANHVLDYIMAKTMALTAPTEVYIGLCTNNPEETSGTVSELAGGAYHRVLISNKGDDYPDVIGRARDRMIMNTKQINWTKATSNWAEAKGFFLASSPTVGNTDSVFFYGKLEEPVTCAAGAVALFDPQSLRISFPEVDSEL